MQSDITTENRSQPQTVSKSQASSKPQPAALSQTGSSQPATSAETLQSKLSAARSRTVQALTNSAFTTALRRAVWSGTAATVFSGLTVAWRAHVERLGAWRGINAVSQWRWGDDALRQTRARARYTLPALMTHHASAIFWAAIYERWLQRGAQNSALPTRNIVKRAAGVTALAWFVDFHLTPKRLTPGFEKVISKRSLVMTYAAFGCGLGAAALWSARRKQRAAQTAETQNPRSRKITEQLEKLPPSHGISQSLNTQNAAVSPADWTPPLH